MNCDELVAPTANKVLAACKRFDAENEMAESALATLFAQYPTNHDRSHVLLKVVSLNALYSTQIFVFSEKVPNVLDVAQHIHDHAKDIDTALKAGSPEIVDA